MDEIRKKKLVGQVAIFGGLGCYLLVFMLVRFLNLRITQHSSDPNELFGNVSVFAAVAMVVGILMKFKGNSVRAIIVKAIIGLVMTPFIFISLIYFPYFIPFSGKSESNPQDTFISAFVVAVGLLFLGIAYSAFRKIRRVHGTTVKQEGLNLP